MSSDTDKANEVLSFISDAKPYLKLEKDRPVMWSFVDWKENISQENKTDSSGKSYCLTTFKKVIDLNSNNQQPKEFRTSSERLIRKLLKWFEKGRYDLEITKTGEGRDTDYDIWEVGSNKRESDRE
jgi:hypothetical protein